MPSDTDFYRLARARIDGLREASPDLTPMLDYYGSVLGAQAEAFAAFHPDITGLDKKTCQSRIAEGLPVLTPDDISIDWDSFDRLCARICDIGKEQAGISANMGEWPTPSSDRGEWRDNLLNGLLGDTSTLDEQAAAYNVSSEIFTFVVSQAVGPFLHRYARELRENFADSSWLKGRCPICGGEALMAKLTKETGSRVLHCHLCATEWQFKRVECPFCGNDDQSTLRFFRDDRNPVYRVDVCERCKGYLKAMDERETDEPACLFVEHLVTVHLDIVAEREGYQRPGAARAKP